MSDHILEQALYEHQNGLTDNGSDFNRYQQFALSIAWWNNRTDRPIDPIAYCTMKLAGEVGEAAEKIAKAYRDNNGIFTQERKDAILLELGDPLWYIACLAALLGHDLQDVINRNVAKLQSRAQRGKLGGDGDNR